MVLWDHEYKTPWLSDLGVLRAHSLKNWSTRCVVQAIYFSGKPGSWRLPSDTVVLCLGWGLQSVSQPSLPIFMRILSHFTSVQGLLSQFLEFFQRKLLYVQLQLCLYGRKKFRSLLCSHLGPESHSFGIESLSFLTENTLFLTWPGPY